MPRVVLPAEEAERVAISYTPKKFPANIQQVAHAFVAINSKSESKGESGFRIDKIIAEQTGIAELERLSLEEKVEREALERLKDVQEQAYQQAYQLGLDEGRESAFNQSKEEFGHALVRLDDLLASIENLKVDLIACNETQIVRLVFQLAKRLVIREINEKPELILEIVKEAVQSAQTEENVSVRVSPRDFSFIESIREKLGKDHENVRRASIEAADDVSDGGCIVETNYGRVNATIDQRLNKAWSAIAEKLPKSKDILSTDMSAAPGSSTGDSEGEGGT